MTRRILAALVAAVVTALMALGSGAAYAGSTGGGASPQIIGGGQATEEYPFLASLQYVDPDRPSPLRCGGALIAAEWIVTAAHCVKSGGALLEPSKFRVKMGSNNYNAGTTYEIEKFVAHPYFDGGNESAGDIGLIKLRTPVPYQPIENTLHPAAGTKLIMVGWGRTVEDDPASTSPWLRQVSSELLFFRDCINNDPYDITPGDVCMSTEGGTAGPCNGDSGSPLLWHTGGRWRLVGVDSRGPGESGCLNGNEVYTTTDFYWDWVTEQLEEDHTHR